MRAGCEERGATKAHKAFLKSGRVFVSLCFWILYFGFWVLSVGFWGVESGEWGAGRVVPQKVRFLNPTHLGVMRINEAVG